MRSKRRISDDKRREVVKSETRYVFLRRPGIDVALGKSMRRLVVMKANGSALMLARFGRFAQFDHCRSRIGAGVTLRRALMVRRLRYEDGSGGPRQALGRVFRELISVHTMIGIRGTRHASGACSSGPEHYRWHRLRWPSRAKEKECAVGTQR